METALNLISWLLPTSVFVFTLYLLIELRSNIWEEKKVPCLKRKLIFGNIYPTFTLKMSVGQMFESMYQIAGDTPYLGFYIFNKPALFIKDPAIIKHILVKDFNIFMHRNFDLDEKVDPTGPGNLFFNTSSRWKVIRTKISPIFTTSRIKYMYSLMSEVAEDLFKKISTERDANGVLQVAEVNAQYTTDIISSVVLGFKANCLANPDSEYRRIGKKAFELSKKRGFEVVSFWFTPSLANFLGFKSMPGQIVEMMANAFSEMVKYREENDIRRNDLVELLSQLQKEASSGNNNENSEYHLKRIAIRNIVVFFSR